jgi:hypothetical protein
MDVVKVVCLPFMSETEDPVPQFQIPDPLVPCLNMDGSQSKKTSLQCMLDNFKREYTGDYRWSSHSRNWKFCQIGWVSFDVGWPSEGSLDRETICRVYQVVSDRDSRSS